MNTNCEYYESLMSRMLDDDLLPQEFALLEEHTRTCRSCGAQGAAYYTMQRAMQDDPEEPPAELHGAIMHKVKVDATASFLESVFEKAISEPPAQPVRRKKRWMPTVIAACLVLVIGVSVFSGRGKSADTAETEAFSAERNAAEAPAAMMVEESAVMDTAAGSDAAPMEPAAPAPEAEEGEAEMETGAVQGYTLSDPAFVPEGSEAAFEALLTDAGYMPEGELHAFWYVEHRGVIYEFMTNEAETLLLWRDAAEGSPLLSQSSFDDLWAIFK